MKAICITDQYTTSAHVYPLVVGELYTITGSPPGHDNYVMIAEHPKSKRGNIAAYRKESFGLLDTDLDETTLVNEEWEGKVCVPVNK